MNKRGQAETLELTTLFEVLIGLAVAAFLIFAALNWNSLTTFNKVYLEEDLKLLSNSVLSTPSSVKVTYPLNSNFNIKIGDEIRVIHTPKLIGVEESDLILESTPTTFDIRRTT